MTLPCLHMASSPSQANWRALNSAASLISFGGGVSLHTATDSEPGHGVLSLTPTPSKPAPVRTFSSLVDGKQHLPSKLPNKFKAFKFIHQRLSSSAEKVGTGGFAHGSKRV